MDIEEKITILDDKVSVIKVDQAHISGRVDALESQAERHKKEWSKEVVELQESFGDDIERVVQSFDRLDATITTLNEVLSPVALWYNNKQKARSDLKTTALRATVGLVVVTTLTGFLAALAVVLKHILMQVYNAQLL